MSLCHVSWSSKILGKQVAMNVILPESGSPPFPTYYLFAMLEEAAIEHQYREFGGTHSWDYWNEHVQEALQFHCQSLNKSKCKIKL